MTAPEILHRIRVAAGNSLERRRVRPVPLRMGLARTAGDAWAGATWCIDLVDRDHVRSALRTLGEWDPRHADQFLAHRFSFFALENADFGPTIQWNRDYRNGVATPLDYGPSLDYRDARVCGDIKYAWEHNRHLHLVELAKAAYLTGEQRYADEIVAQVTSWITSSPYPLGINWASSLENAIRVINWCYALNFLRSPGTDFADRHREALRQWTASVYEHLVFIRNHFSQYSSANNHRIGEAAGLFVGALCFHFPQSAEWLATARRILLEESEKQTWPDGVNKEQATSYQAFVFDFLLVCGLLAKCNGQDFGGAFWERLEAMAEYVAALLDDNGDVPAIGDDDEGRVVVLSYSPDFKLYRSLLATSAALFGRSDFRKKAVAFDEKSFWLLGQAGMDRFTRAGRTGEDRTMFERGGYAVLRDGEARAIVDCGPLGYLSLAAHGHADALSVLLDYRGRHFLVDPGTYAYHTGKVWRNYFRGTAAHNTMRVDGQDQSVIGGNFMWIEKAACTLEYHDDHAVRARHDGYQRLPDPVTHERTVTLAPGSHQMVLEDAVLGEGRHQVEFMFHFHPDCVVEKVAEGYSVTNNGVGIVLLPDPSLTSSQVLKGSVDPIGGWYSPGFDRKVPCPTLVLTGNTLGTKLFRTIVRLVA